MTDPTKTTVTRFTVISNPNPNPNPPRKRVVGRESTLEIVGEKPADFADCVYDRELYSKPAETVPHRHKFGVVPVGTDEGRAAATGSRPGRCWRSFAQCRAPIRKARNLSTSPC